MIESFFCPNCAAPLDYDGVQAVLHCPYCGSALAVKQPVAAGPAAGPAADPQLPDPSLAEVAALFRAGRRVQATIMYREITGASLAEASQALDRFAGGGPLRRPSRMGGSS